MKSQQPYLVFYLFYFCYDIRLENRVEINIDERVLGTIYEEIISRLIAEAKKNLIKKHKTSVTENVIKYQEWRHCCSS